MAKKKTLAQQYEAQLTRIEKRLIEIRKDWQTSDPIILDYCQSLVNQANDCLTDS